MKNWKTTFGAILLVVLPATGFAQPMVTAHQVAVTQSGALQITVPVRLPAGTATYLPKISVTYNSRSGLGNVGGGWSIDGLPRIMRCPMTNAVDGKRKNVTHVDDVFCVDGERLIAVSGAYGADGTEYRTEHDSFTKYISHGSATAAKWDFDSQSYRMMPTGPQSFSAFDKNGYRLEFGGAGLINTRAFEKLGNLDYSHPPIKGWALSQVLDRTNTQVMFVDYDAISPSNGRLLDSGAYVTPDDGYFRPKKITYKIGATKGLVSFNWLTFTDTLPLEYEAGYPKARPSRLASVSTCVLILSGAGCSGGDSFQLTLNPDASRLDQSSNDYPVPEDTAAPYRVDSFVANDAGQIYDPIKFTYEPVGSFQKIFGSWNGSAFPGLRNDYKHYFLDLDGDGKKYWVQLSQAGDEAWFGKLGTASAMAASNWTKSSVSNGSLNEFEHYFADLNGDGKLDWLRVSRASNEGWVALGAGGGAFLPWSKVAQAVGSNDTFGHFFADIDGDGNADWIQISRSSDVSQIAYSNGDGSFKPWVNPAQQFGLATWDSYFADVTGDGRADWIVVQKVQSYAVTYVNRGNGQFGLAPGRLDLSGQKTPVFSFGDINGDNLPDVYITTTPLDIGFYALSKGDGTFTLPFKTNVPAGTNASLVDLDGDGWADSVFDNPSKYMGATFSYSRGMFAEVGGYPSFIGPYGNYPANPVGSAPLPLGSFSFFYADLNGDGKPDLIFQNLVTKATWYALNTLGDPYRITAIARGTAGTTTVQYKPLNDKDVYVADTNAVAPIRDTIYPLLRGTRAPYVVASISSPNGLGGNFTSRYMYGGKKVDISRQAELGFRWMKTTNVASGRVAYMEYRQDWPYAGLNSLTTDTLGSGKLVGQNSVTYGCTDFVSATGCTVGPGKRYFTTLRQADSASWDLNGTAYPTVTTTSEYDSFGNPTIVVTRSSDGYEQTVNTTYSNDTSKWWLGFPTSTTTTVVKP